MQHFCPKMLHLYPLKGGKCIHHAPSRSTCFPSNACSTAYYHTYNQTGHPCCLNRRRQHTPTRADTHRPPAAAISPRTFKNCPFHRRRPNLRHPLSGQFSTFFLLLFQLDDVRNHQSQSAAQQRTGAVDDRHRVADPPDNFSTLHIAGHRAIGNTESRQQAKSHTQQQTSQAQPARRSGTGSRHSQSVGQAFSRQILHFFYQHHPFLTTNKKVKQFVNHSKNNGYNGHSYQLFHNIYFVLLLILRESHFRFSALLDASTAGEVTEKEKKIFSTGKKHPDNVLPPPKVRAKVLPTACQAAVYYQHDSS